MVYVRLVVSEIQLNDVLAVMLFSSLSGHIVNRRISQTRQIVRKWHFHFFQRIIILNLCYLINCKFFVKKKEIISYRSVFLLWLLHVLTREIICLFSVLCFQKEHTKHLIDVTGYPVIEGSLSPENNKCQLITHN